MGTIAVIPARYQSERLPGKPLAEIAGEPMVQHVYRRASRARLVERVLVATDDERILRAVEDFGGEAVLTSKDHSSGTDRIAEAVAALEFRDVVNVQGDEPFVDPDSIDEAIEASRRHEAIATLKKAIESSDELWNPNVVKVVTDRRGLALYFSRWPIPFVASTGFSDSSLPMSASKGMPTENHFRHVGLYVYPKHVLLELVGRAPTPLERSERLEQLRALENGFPIHVEETTSESLSVDTPADLERARDLTRKRSQDAPE